MSGLVVIKGYLCIDGKRYSEMNWFEQKIYDLKIMEKKTTPLGVANRSLIKKAVQK